MLLHTPPSLFTMFDFEGLQPEIVTIPSAGVDRAVRLSRQVRSQENSWQTYRTLLALSGFQQWLAESGVAIPMDDSQCYLLWANDRSSPVICNFSVGAFKVCLISVGSLPDPWTTVPSSVVEQPAWAAHFYVLVEVHEECFQARVNCFLRYDQLRAQLQGASLASSPIVDEYRLPLSTWEQEPEQLLLHLQCLNPEAIQLPATPSPSPKALSLPILLQPVLNVALWLRNEMDEFTQHWKWVLLPELATEMRSSMLSPIEELGKVMAEVERHLGEPLRPQSRAAYQDFQLGNNQLRLYVVTWSLLSPAGVPEWTLLLILGPQPEQAMALGTHLQIQDETGILVDQILEKALSPAYLFAKIIGTLEEQFTVTIALPNGTALTLPPFAFQVESPL